MPVGRDNTSKNHGISYPPVIAIDRDLALLNALGKDVPTSQVLLCTWHINKNVTKNCKSMFPCNESWKHFYSHWHKVMYAASESDFEQNWNSMQDIFGIDSVTVSYLNNTWIPNVLFHVLPIDIFILEVI